MAFSEKLAYRLKKDHKFPFPITSNEDIFNYYLKLFDKRLNSNLEWQCLLFLAEKYGSDEQLLENISEIQNILINTIKNSPKFEEFNNAELPNVKFDIPSGDVYKSCNVGKRFLSIDLNNANFQILKQHGVINPYTNWKQFMWDALKASGMTPDVELINYLAEAKNLRQVIFGNCNPKRIVTWEKYYMNEIRKYLDYTLPESYKLVSMNSDELIYEITDKNEFFDLQHAYTFETAIKKNFNLDVTINKFTFEEVRLVSIESSKIVVTGYLLDVWGEKQFKCVPETYAALFEEWLNAKKNEEYFTKHNFTMYSRLINHDGLICSINDRLYVNNG